MDLLKYIKYDEIELDILEDNILNYFHQNENLSNLNKSHLNDIKLSIDSKINNFIDTYVKIPIKVNDKFDIYILIWNKCITKIHNHAKNGCIMKVLKGSLLENRFDEKLKKISSNKIDENSISYIDDSLGYHNIQNNKELCVSLHIYSPPNFNTLYF